MELTVGRSTHFAMSAICIFLATVVGVHAQVDARAAVTCSGLWTGVTDDRQSRAIALSASTAPEVAPDSDDVLNRQKALSNDIDTASASGNLFAAISAARQLIEVDASVFGQNHNTTVGIRIQLAQLLYQASDFRQAESIFATAYPQLIGIQGAGGEDTQIAEVYLTNALARLGRCSEAQAIHRRFLTKYEEWKQDREQISQQDAKQCADMFVDSGKPRSWPHQPSGFADLVATSLPSRADLDAVKHMQPKDSDFPDTVPGLTAVLPKLRANLAAIQALVGTRSEAYALQEFQYGTVLAELGKWSEAIPLQSHAYSVSVQIHSSLAQGGYYLLIRSLVGSGRCVDALALRDGRLPSVAQWRPMVVSGAGQQAAAGPTAGKLDDPDLFDKVSKLVESGNFDAAIAQARAAQRSAASGPPITRVTADMALGFSLLANGQIADADPYLRDIMVASADWSDGPPNILPIFALLELSQGQFDNAKQILSTVLVKAYASHDANQLLASRLLILALIFQGKNDEAEHWARQTLVALQADPVARISALFDLGGVLTQEAQFPGALAQFDEALELIATSHSAHRPGMEHLVAEIHAGRAWARHELGQDATAELTQAANAMVRFSSKALIARLENNVYLARANHMARHYVDAEKVMAATCPAIDRSGAGPVYQRYFARECYSLRAINAFALNPAADFADGFQYAQTGEISRAGDAIVSSQARAGLAKDMQPVAGQFEQAERRSAGIDKGISTALASGDTARARELEDRRDEQDRIAEQAKTRLRQDRRASQYLQLTRPEPVPVARLQSILRPGEVLVFWFVPAQQDKGLVFAVSKTDHAWSEIAIGDQDISTLVKQVRPKVAGGGFDRQAAYELYKALFVHDAITRVIGVNTSLVIVPSGALTALPPGILVTTPPQGPATTADDALLRATAWLLRSKVITVMPSISAFAALRDAPITGASVPSQPLLAFAAPDFGGHGQKCEQQSGVTPVPSFSEYYSGATPVASALLALKPLCGAADEARALQRVLGAPATSVLLGAQATRRKVFERNSDGTLAKVRVLSFATHGLVAGSGLGITEPALVLAFTRNQDPREALLTTSDVATLNLSAEWVLLSACNTASKDGPESEGISGLARAFFFAGAKTLLVSHWPVQDDVAAVLVPQVLRYQLTEGLGHAQALQKAELAMLDDPLGGHANPLDWAPFVAMGEPGQ